VKPSTYWGLSTTRRKHSEAACHQKEHRYLANPSKAVHPTNHQKGNNHADNRNSAKGRICDHGDLLHNQDRSGCHQLVVHDWMSTMMAQRNLRMGPQMWSGPGLTQMMTMYQQTADKSCRVVMPWARRL
jgi:hypothetical protein